MRRLGRIAIAVALLTVLFEAAPATGAMAASAPAPRISRPADAAGVKGATCAAPAWMHSGNASMFPDSNAGYWAYQFELKAGEKLVVTGQYPAARYFSFVTYNSDSIVEHVIDSGIRPDDGSSNPYAVVGAKGGSYTLTVSTLVGPDAGVSNTIAAGMQPGHAIGLLQYRVYLPNEPKSIEGSVALPKLTVKSATGETLPEVCPTLLKVAPPEGGMSKLPASILRPQFIRSNTNGVGANPDNAYVAARINWQPGRVVVLHGKAPSFPDTRRGVSVATGGQMRYWSICTNEMKFPFPATQCAADYEIPLDADRYYTVVISAKADRPANATLANGYLWLEWNTNSDGAVLLRNMLPLGGFAQAAQGVVPNTSDLSVMGIYEPAAKYCTKTAFERRTCGLD